MAGSAGNISFANAHLYVDFDASLENITTAADTTAMWTALKTKFEKTDYVNKVSSTVLPVQAAVLIDIPNMGAQSQDKMADLPTTNEAVIEVGWSNEDTQIVALRGKKLHDDIAVALVLNTDDTAAKDDPLRGSTAATAAYYSGQIASVAPAAPQPGQRAAIRITIAAIPVDYLDQA